MIMNTEKNMVLARMAVKSNDIAAVQSLLLSGFDFSQNVKSFPSMISLAFLYCREDMLKLMLRHNKTKFLDYINNNRNLLNEIYCNSEAALPNKRKLIRFLFDNFNGITIKSKNEEIIRAIIKSDDNRTFELLCELHGKFLHSKQSLKNIFLTCIESNNNNKLAKHIYKKFNEKDINKLIVLAFDKGYPNVIRFFMESGVDVTVIGKKMVNIYEFLMPFSDETYPAFKLLIDAEKNGKFKTSKTMKSEAAVMAARCGLRGALMDLIDFDINVKIKNSNGYNLLRTYVEKCSSNSKDNFNLIKKLIEIGVDAKFIDKCDDTLLHNLSYYNSGDLMTLVELFELLIKHDVDINAKNDDGETVAFSIIEGCDSNKVEFLKYIITKFGADMSIRNHSGYNTLMIVCLSYFTAYKENKSIINAIMKCPKIDINAVCEDGKTALMMALDECCFESILALLEYDIDVTIVDKDGKNAYDYLNKWNDKNKVNIICDLLDEKIINSQKIKNEAL